MAQRLSKSLSVASMPVDGDVAVLLPRKEVPRSETPDRIGYVIALITGSVGVTMRNWVTSARNGVMPMKRG